MGASKTGTYSRFNSSNPPAKRKAKSGSGSKAGSSSVSPSKLAKKIDNQNDSFAKALSRLSTVFASAPSLDSAPRPSEPTPPPTRNLAGVQSAGDLARQNAKKKGLSSTIFAGSTGASNFSLVPDTGGRPILGF